jgi:N-acetylmuramoyl-L-alanine amidase
MAKYYVWLDAGHSKATAGKRNTVANPDFFEYEFNNDIAVKLKKRLEEHGITVYLTNTTPNGADISLTKRANIANDKWKALGKPSNAIFVSLHGNASTGAWAKARGVEVYHAGNASAKSKELALLLTNQIYNDVKKIDSGFKNRGRKSANFTVIYKALMKAVLIEHGFYDNKEDLALMQDHRNIFVEADCKAICKYFGITYKAPNISKPVTSTNYIVKVIYEGSDGLNIRKEATTSSAVVGVVYCGEAFTIVEEKNGWGKLKSGLGWISLNSKYVKKI